MKRYFPVLIGVYGTFLLIGVAVLLTAGPGTTASVIASTLGTFFVGSIAANFSLWWLWVRDQTAKTKLNEAGALINKLVNMYGRHLHGAWAPNSESTCPAWCTPEEFTPVYDKLNPDQFRALFTLSLRMMAIKGLEEAYARGHEGDDDA
jgi:hypothetical protein